MYLCNSCTRDSSRDITILRNSDTNLCVPFMNTKNGLQSFSYRGARLWNDLKPRSKNSLSLFAFTRAIKQCKQYKKAPCFEPSIRSYLILSKTVHFFRFVFRFLTFFVIVAIVF